MYPDDDEIECNAGCCFHERTECELNVYAEYWRLVLLAIAAMWLRALYWTQLRELDKSSAPLVAHIVFDVKL